MRLGPKAISVLLHPLVMPILGALCYFHLFPSIEQYTSDDAYWRILLALFSLTFVLPLLCVIIMMKVGKVSTMFMEDQRERNWPLLITAAIYMGASWILNQRNIPGFIQIFLFGAVVSMVIAALINVRWKISLHMIGIGGLCGGLTILYAVSQEGNPLWLAYAFFLAGLLGSARLMLGAHNITQVLVGFLLGFTVELGLGVALVH